MDVQMPVMGGFEATRLVRQQEQENGNRRHQPIIALTAMAIKGDRERCMEAGMDAYVTKPFKKEELQSAIDKVTPNIQPQQAIVPSPAKPKGETLDRLEALLQDDPVLAQQVIELFLEHTPHRMVMLSAAIANRDFVGVEQSAHYLKGSIANFGSDRSFTMSARLEELARLQDFSLIPSVFNQLEDALSQLSLQIKKNIT